MCLALLYFRIGYILRRKVKLALAQAVGVFVAAAYNHYPPPSSKYYSIRLVPAEPHGSELCLPYCTQQDVGTAKKQIRLFFSLSNGIHITHHSTSHHIASHITTTCPASQWAPTVPSTPLARTSVNTHDTIENKKKAHSRRKRALRATIDQVHIRSSEGPRGAKGVPSRDEASLPGPTA